MYSCMHFSRAADVNCLSVRPLPTIVLPFQPKSLRKHVTKEMLEIEAFERETIKYKVTITKSKNQNRNSKSKRGVGSGSVGVRDDCIFVTCVI